jgi:EAL domain-containing protein (putative c-di-GMP-specific phosphodiesterase class I)
MSVEVLNPTIPVRWALAGHGVFADSFGCISVRGLPCQIGRKSDADVQLSHLSVSGSHAVIFAEGSTLLLKDLGSRNGTFLNGRRIASAESIREGDLMQFGEVAFRLQRDITHSQSITPSAESLCDLALALAQFDRLLADKAFVAHYQPIVAAQSHSTIAYEALARSRMFGLTSPAMMFKAAAYFSMEAELSRLLRTAAIDLRAVASPPHLFLNTHPKEMQDLTELVKSLRQLRKQFPAAPITLEVHESSAAEMTSMKMLRLALTDLRIELAYDDFGAGQSRFEELIEARPDVLKFDMKLIRNIHEAPTSRQQLLGSLVKMARELGIRTLAEGVEKREEVELCQEVGFELFQGYYFGKPGPASTWFRRSPVWREEASDPEAALAPV